jgi:hypothetical protein
MATEVQSTTLEPKLQESAALVPAKESSNVVKYILIGVITISLVLLVYYAYARFIDNSLTEPMSKGVEQERDDPVVDFNLREAIKNLQNIQKNVLSTLSDVSDI